MGDNDDIRLVLEQDGPYAFKGSFEGSGLEDLHTDEPAPRGAGAGTSAGAASSGVAVAVENCP